jgi:hypothetical protein
LGGSLVLSFLIILSLSFFVFSFATTSSSPSDSVSGFLSFLSFFCTSFGVLSAALSSALSFFFGSEILLSAVASSSSSFLSSLPFLPAAILPLLFLINCSLIFWDNRSCSDELCLLLSVGNEYLLSPYSIL